MPVLPTYPHSHGTRNVLLSLELGVMGTLSGANGGSMLWPVCRWLLSRICLGVLLGIPGGYLLLHILSYFSIPFDVVIDPTFFLVTLLFVIAVSFIASIGPVLGALRLRIREYCAMNNT